MEHVYNVEKSIVKKPSNEPESTDVPPKKKSKVSSLYPQLDHSRLINYNVNALVISILNL